MNPPVVLKLLPLLDRIFTKGVLTRDKIGELLGELLFALRRILHKVAKGGKDVKK